MSTALQLHDSDMGSWAVIRQQAEVLVKTGFLPQSIKTPEQAMKDAQRESERLLRTYK